MVVTKKMLIGVGCAVLALFIVANPLGDAHHGMGKHNAFLADLGQTLFVASLIGAAAFIVLAIVAAYQHLRPAHQKSA